MFNMMSVLEEQHSISLWNNTSTQLYNSVQKFYK